MFKNRLEYWVDPRTGKPRQLFNQLYRDYPDPWGCEKAKTILSKKIFLEMISEGARKKLAVLDLGCGEGGYTREIKKKLGKSANVTGLEISPLAVKRARQRYRDVNFRVGNLNHLNNRCLYDRIILSEVMWYLTRTIHSALQKIRRVLKADGRVCIHQYFPKRQRYFRNIRGIKCFLQIVEKNGFIKIHHFQMKVEPDGEVFLGVFGKR